VSDPTLLLLALDMVALLTLGAGAALVPPRFGGWLASGLSLLGAALCLPPLLFPSAAALSVPAGPPGLHLHFALGPLPASFLLLILLSGGAIAAFGSATRTTALCLGGAILSLLAADGVGLLFGTAILCGALCPDRTRRSRLYALLVPLLLAGAVLLLTPTGFEPRFDAVRAAPVGVERASIAAMLASAAITGLICLRGRGGTDALAAGVVLPAAIAILVRLLDDLSGQTVQGWWGFVLIALGGGIAVLFAWRAAADAGLGDALANLVRRQGGLAMLGTGLALIARAADLPQAQSLALESAMLLVFGGGLAGTAATLAAEAIGASAGTARLSRLGGLIHTMPWSSGALAAGLLALSALPPGIGFASVWLLFQSLLYAPRTGSFLEQLPLALAALAIALSAAAATSACVRVIGIGVLGRPRSPSGAGAQEVARVARIILTALAAPALIVGLSPGPVIRALAAPAVRSLIGSSPGIRGGVTMLSTSAASPGYAALPVAALLACAIGCVIMLLRWRRGEAKTGGLWFGGMKPPFGLPFGEPMAQSAGAGFLPALPYIAFWKRLAPPLFRHGPAQSGPPGAAPADRLAPGNAARFRTIPVSAALWLVLAAFGILLLAVAATGAGA
jgi:formate hydrogenlyase subunit 3/multisubunit Na+/H+ antiporter MnhD subunit